VGHPALVLNLSILADVYLNRVTYWDDAKVRRISHLILCVCLPWLTPPARRRLTAKIVALNPTLPLPHMPIRTIVQTTLSGMSSPSPQHFSPRIFYPWPLAHHPALHDSHHFGLHFHPVHVRRRVQLYGTPVHHTNTNNINTDMCRNLAWLQVLLCDCRILSSGGHGVQRDVPDPNGQQQHPLGGPHRSAAAGPVWYLFLVVAAAAAVVVVAVVGGGGWWVP
jgi:hypothetical protein